MDSHIWLVVTNLFDVRFRLLYYFVGMMIPTGSSFVGRGAANQHSFPCLYRELRLDPKGFHREGNNIRRRMPHLVAVKH